jgi:RNA polymerase sigma factor (sigma-70 family)
MRGLAVSAIPPVKKSARSRLCHTLPMTGVSDDRARWLAEEVLPCEPGLRAWLARRRVADLDVDDIVQEAYAVLAELKTVEHIRNPRTYLYSVAHSIILQHVRRLRIVAIETMAEVDRLGIYSEQPTPEETLSDFQELRVIARLIAALPHKCGEAFILRKVEGLSQREVAERMQISESTVEKHIGKAIRLLMGVLKGGDNADPTGGATTQTSASLLKNREQSDE